MKKHNSQKIIFIVEDDPDICELMEIVLTKKGFQIKKFLDGTRVEAEIKKTKPNLVIMDLWMPNFDGAKLTKKLKNNPKTKKIPIVIVSAKNALEKITKLSEADGFLSKPFNLKDLTATVQKFIS